MKPLALAAASAAVVLLAACSQAHPTSATPARHATVTHSAVLVNCPLKYKAWKQSPAKKLVSALKTFDSAGAVEGSPALTAALKKAGRAVLSAERYPIPACADPKGYWTALLMHVNAAANNAGSGSESASTSLALKAVPGIERKLTAELKSTVGLK
jgi:hypothetical protein